MLGRVLVADIYVFNFLQMLMRLPRERSRISLLPTTELFLSLIPVDASPRSSEVPVPEPVTRSLTVKRLGLGYILHVLF
jgi:hypothetical protein